MNARFQEIFCPTPEQEHEQQKRIDEIKQKLIDDKHCCFCVHSVDVPHYEHGYDAGTDPYCKMYDELMLEYGKGQECIFWELNKKK